MLAYAYDLNGRRISLSYPSLLRPYSRAAAEYLYTDWGALEAIRGLAGEWYSFGYDEESRLTSIVYPQDTGLTESFVYDSDGRRIIRKLGTAAMPGSVYDDSLVYDWRGKVTKAFLRASSRVVENWYDGLGRVVASSWQSTISGDLNVDQFRTDPYGNIAWSRKRDGFGNAPEYENHYDPYGRITLVQLAPTSPNPSTWSHEWREYDAAGNVSFAAEVRFGPGQMEPTTEVHRRTTRYYYSADKRLVYSQRFARDPIDMGGDSDDLFEEIRYDALGRRILVRTQHAPFGAVGKSDAITRFVWDGDQLLGELRASGDQLEATFGTGRQYGRVTYLHGGEIDKPLGVYRNDFSNAVGPTLIVPYVNWRGQHERGTFVGGAPECTGSHSDCIHVEWPAPKMRTYLDGQAPGEGDWVGSLLQDQLDESGLLYRRNRYYDPNTGQFTQEDPIGIAGGLNLYGFADGDPLTY
ncbi:MAG: RHS repeat-associated core domain-containing protein, partial [Acidimicrobiia bacterium]